MSLQLVGTDKEPHALLLRALEVVDGPLSDDDRKAIQDHVVGTIKDYDTRDDIVREGDKPEVCAIVVSGMCCRYKVVGDGNRQIMSFHIPGDAPDVQSLFLKTMDHSLGTLDGATILHV